MDLDHRRQAAQTTIFAYWSKPNGENHKLRVTHSEEKPDFFQILRSCGDRIMCRKSIFVDIEVFEDSRSVELISNNRIGLSWLLL